MSVRLDEFCETSQSKFAEALKVALQNAIFINSDEVTIEKEVGSVRAYVDVMHTITKMDSELIISIFDGLDWQIGPSCEKCTFRVVFYLTAGWL